MASRRCLREHMKKTCPTPFAVGQARSKSRSPQCNQTTRNGVPRSALTLVHLTKPPGAAYPRGPPRTVSFHIPSLPPSFNINHICCCSTLFSNPCPSLSSHRHSCQHAHHNHSRPRSFFQLPRCRQPDTRSAVRAYRDTAASHDRTACSEPGCLWYVVLYISA